MLDYSYLLKEADEIGPEIKQIREMFHKNPELGFKEYKTSSFVVKYLEECGLEVKRNVGKTGVIGLLKGKNNTKTVALRADMDALPIQEENNVSYKSEVDGVMHACGHDGHTAMLLGAAKVLSRHKDEIDGTIKFIFQPDEEGPEVGGAKELVDEGVLDGVDAIFGLHISTAYPTGTIGINMKETSASADVFEIEILGKGGHAASPHLAVDSIAIAAKYIDSIQYLITREIDPMEPIVISIGTINGGFASNVIADKVKITGTIRTQSNEMRSLVPEKMENILKHLTEMAGGSYKFEILPGLPPLINNTEMAEFVYETCTSITGCSKVIKKDKPQMGGEDFAFYLQEIPGAMFWLGAANKEKGFINQAHSPYFDFDEDALVIGTKAHIILALKFLADK